MRKVWANAMSRTTTSKPDRGEITELLNRCDECLAYASQPGDHHADCFRFKGTTETEGNKSLIMFFIIIIQSNTLRCVAPNIAQSIFAKWDFDYISRSLNAEIRVVTRFMCYKYFAPKKHKPTTHIWKTDYSQIHISCIYFVLQTLQRKPHRIVVLMDWTGRMGADGVLRWQRPYTDDEFDYFN